MDAYICNLGRLSFYKRSMKKLVQQKILYFQGFSATLFLHSRTIRSQILCEVCDGVARDLHGARRPRVTRGELWENARRVVDKVRLEPSLLDLLLGQIARKLVNDRADHLEMPQLLCADCGSPRTTNAKKPCTARVTGRKRERKRECAKRRLAPFL